MKKLLSLLGILVIFFSFNLNSVALADIYYSVNGYQSPEQDAQMLEQESNKLREEQQAAKQQKRAVKRQKKNQAKAEQKRAKADKKAAKRAEKSVQADANKKNHAADNEGILTKAEKKKAEKEAKRIAKAEKKAKNTDKDNVKATQTRESSRFPEAKAKSPMSSNPNYGTDTPIGRELRILDRSASMKKRSALAVKLNPNLDIREVRASHILVKKRQDAVMIKKEIESGAISFEEAAKKYSMCPSAVRGGDLGFFKRDKMEPQFSERAFDTKIGTISDPVGTKFGWHLIKTTDKR
ncbi:peptidylprolyl isomerase [bacterium]|nr:peptidylprolyl isomerase [bacterium]